MPRNVMIGIGGTGARVLEAVVQLCAVGYGPDNLTMFLIDPDEANGNLNRTKELIDMYVQCQQQLAHTPATEDKMFRTKITVPGTHVWKIFKDHHNSLAYHINYETMDTNLADFASILFSELELKTSLNEGFRGHPSIGAVVMADPPQDEEPWTVLWDDITSQKQNDVRVFLVGSVFGGTGAAGVPTIGSKNLIKYNQNAVLGQGKSRVLLGGTLVLPYFSFEKEDESDEKMFVTTHDFPIATKAALHYYNEKELGFDQIYLVGDSHNQKVGKFSVGSRSQENQPHFIELVTGLSAMDFFLQSPIEGDPEKLYFLAGRDDETLTWEALPVTRNSAEIRNKQMLLKSRLINMATFAYTLCTYGKTILDTRHDDVNDAWYRDNFKFNEKKEKERVLNPRFGDSHAQLEMMQRYLKRFFLPWICALDDNSGKVKLFDRTKIANTQVQVGKEVSLYPYDKYPNNIGDFLKEASESKDFGFFINRVLNTVNLSGEKTLSAANRYINIFYEAAEKFVSQNYNIR